MKEIPLTQGYVALVDDADFEVVNAFKWHVQKRVGGAYAVRRIKRDDGTQFRFYLHEALFPGVRYVENLDGNGLNYARENLRPLTEQKISSWASDHTGKKYGRWTVLSYAGTHPQFKGAIWRCRCDCGNEREVYVNAIVSGGSKSCGCYQKEYCKSLKGDKHPSWKGGWRIDQYGYVLVNNAEYPGSESKANTTAEHIVVMARHLGRPIRDGETVHHKNGIKHDNRIENLELWKSAHPSGQRVSDLIAWAKQLLGEYSPESLSDKTSEKTTNQSIKS